MVARGTEWSGAVVRRADFAHTPSGGGSLDPVFKPTPPEIVRKIRPRQHHVLAVYREIYAHGSRQLLVNTYAVCRCGLALVIRQDGPLAADEEWEAGEEIEEARGHFRSLNAELVAGKRRKGRDRKVWV